MVHEEPEEAGSQESEGPTDETASGAPSPPSVIEGLQGLDRAQLVISAFLIAVIGILAYSSVFRLPYHLDDREFLVENEALHRLETVSQTWDPQSLRPVTALSLALNWSLGNGSPIAFHLVNLLLHLLNGILIFLICKRLLSDDTPVALSMAAGMLFVAHPALTQAVNHIPDRSLLLGTTFVLLSVLFFLLAVRQEGKVSYGATALSLFCFALAWGADAAALIVPFLLVLAVTAVHRHQTLRERTLLFAPYGLLLAGLLVATASGHPGSGPATSGPLSAFTQARALNSYIAPTFLPIDLQVAYPIYEAELSGLPWRWAFLLIAAAVLMRFAPVPSFAILWYLLAVLAQGLFTVNPSFDEARLYLPLAGLVLILPWCLSKFQAPPIRLIAGLTSILLILAGIVMTFMRNNQWRSETGLWVSANEACPTCYAPVEHLAFLYLAQGERTLRPIAENEAVLHVDAIRKEAMGYFTLAKAYFELGATSEQAGAAYWHAYGRTQNHLGNPLAAVQALKSALRLDPDHQQSLLLLAALAADRAEATGYSADIRRAIEYLRRAQDAAQLPPAGVVRYANLLARIGDLRGASLALSTLQQSELEQIAARDLNEIGLKVQATQALQSAIDEKVQEDPANPEILLLNARRLHLEGRYISSSYFARQALRNSLPTPAEAWALLGINSARTESTQQFLLDWPAGPGSEFDAGAWRDLARLCASSGEWAGAFDFLRYLAANTENQTSALALLANVAAEVGDIQRAGAYYQQAIEQESGDVYALLGMADLLLAQDQTDAARQYLVRAKANGASETDLEERLVRAGIEDFDSVGTRRTIIR